jgi:hypothetical protein
MLPNYHRLISLGANRADRAFPYVNWNERRIRHQVSIRREECTTEIQTFLYVRRDCCL